MKDGKRREEVMINKAREELRTRREEMKQESDKGKQRQHLRGDTMRVSE